jgi:hypothetical protein
MPRIGNRNRRDAKRMREPLDIGGVVIESWQKHIAIGGTTGARKTTLIANLIMRSTEPVAFIAGDSSPFAIQAIRAIGGYVWSPSGDMGLYCFPGTPNEAAQIATILLKRVPGMSDSGLQRGMARGVFREYFELCDAQGAMRTWEGLEQYLYVARPPRGLPNRNFEQMRANWISRIIELRAQLGPALGNDLNVVDILRSGVSFGFDLNAFSDIELAEDFGELAVRLVQHAADSVGNFWWIVDELSLFNSELLARIVRTCRVRLVKFVGASQVISDFGDTLRGLVKVWYIGEQTAADGASRKWCSDLTMGYVPPENFAEQGTPPGFFYVVADGRIQEAQLPIWRTPRESEPRVVQYRSAGMRGLPLNLAGLPAGSSGDDIDRGSNSPQSRGEQTTDSDAGASTPLVSPRTQFQSILLDRIGERSSDDLSQLPALNMNRIDYPEPVPQAIQTDADLLRMWGKLRRRGERSPLWHPERGLYWSDKGCLNWTGGPSDVPGEAPKRPKSNRGRRTVTVYVEIFAALRGAIPDGLTLDHLCGNVKCCDPEHLDPCTLNENNRREPLRQAQFARIANSAAVLST